MYSNIPENSDSQENLSSVSSSRANAMNKKLSINAIVTIALLIAIAIVLTRFFSIQTLTVRIGFGFLPIAIIAILYGPIYGGIASALADFIGATLFPTAAFFPGFTLSAFLSGAIYGALLYNRPKSTARIIIAVIIISIFIHLGLNTLWLRIITGRGYLILLPGRVLKTALDIPVEIMLIRLFASERLLNRVRNNLA